MTYWTDRFPKLLLHTWLAMQCVKNEDIFNKYYRLAYKFPRLNNDNQIPLWLQNHHTVTQSPRRRYPTSKNGAQKFGAEYSINNYYCTNFFSGTGKISSTENWRRRPSPTVTIDTEKGIEGESNPHDVCERLENGDVVEQNLKINEDSVNSNEYVTNDDSTINEEWQKKRSKNRPRNRGKKKMNGTVTAVD